MLLVGISTLAHQFDCATVAVTYTKCTYCLEVTRFCFLPWVHSILIIYVLWAAFGRVYVHCILSWVYTLCARPCQFFISSQQCSSCPCFSFVSRMRIQCNSQRAAFVTFPSCSREGEDVCDGMVQPVVCVDLNKQMTVYPLVGLNDKKIGPVSAF